MSPKRSGQKKNPVLQLNPTKGASWEVQSRSARCADTEEAFEEGEAFMSRLVARPDGMHREDFKLKAWNEERKKDALFYWKSQFRLPAPKKEEPFREENAEEFLKDLVTKDDPSLVNTLFILAAMLERKRLLVERGVQRDPEGRRIRIYEHKDGGDTYFIQDPELDLESIDDVQREVALQLGWIRPETEGEATEEKKETEESGEDSASENPEAPESKKMDGGD